jgi:hypothetical protein
MSKLRGTVNSAFGNAHKRFAFPSGIQISLLPKICSHRASGTSGRMLVKAQYGVNCEDEEEKSKGKSDEQKD